MTADEWFEGKNASPILMSLRDVFNNLTGNTGKQGGSVLRQASRRLNANALNPNQRDSQQEVSTPAPASMSRLGGMKPPTSTSAGTPTTPLTDSTASFTNVTAQVTTPATTPSGAPLGNGTTSANGAAFNVSILNLSIYL